MCCMIHPSAYVFYKQYSVSFTPLSVSSSTPFPSPHWKPLVCFSQVVAMILFLFCYEHLFVYSLESTYK